MTTARRGLPEQTLASQLQERFEVRTRALVYARVTFMALGLLVLAVPALRRAVGLGGLAPSLFYGGYLALLASHAGSFAWGARRFGRALTFVSLCLDLLVLLYLLLLSGGISSPLMPAQLVFTMLFALLYPSPLAIVPPLLMLPIVARIEQLIGPQSLAEDLLFVLWYSALNVVVVYIVIYLEGREKLALREVVRLQDERRARALAEQRVRIARELHDGVGAALSGILLQAEYLGGSVKEGPLAGELEELRQAAAEGMGELRRAVSLLQREFRLAAALPDYVSAFATRQRIDATCQVLGTEPELQPEVTLTLFRVLQEALTNVARHADAKSAHVRLEFGPGEVALEVADDGRGFAPQQELAGHYGLKNMSERLAKLGGELRIESTSASGTRLAARIPLDPAPS